MKKTENGRELVIYIAVAYGVTFAMGLLMWYGEHKNMDLGIFPNAQMFYPAAGVMAAFLCTRTRKGNMQLRLPASDARVGEDGSSLLDCTGKKNHLIPRAFYVFFICVTIMLAAVAAMSIFYPYEMINAGNGYYVPVWTLMSQLLIIGASIAGWVILLATKKEKRRAYGLCWNNTASSWFCIFLFLALYILRTAISAAASGGWTVLCGLAAKPGTWLQLALLPVNFFLAYTAFFGEEYGWRYYLQPLMQRRFGMRGGVVLLGVVWGLWHLPVDLFYYTQDSQLPMIFAQQITCITIGIFFAYAYMRTENIWVPVALHFLNNNLVPIFSGNYTSSVFENQTVTWGELLAALVMNGLIFGGFLFAKPFRGRAGE